MNLRRGATSRYPVAVGSSDQNCRKVALISVVAGSGPHDREVCSRCSSPATRPESTRPAARSAGG